MNSQVIASLVFATLLATPGCGGKSKEALDTLHGVKKSKDHPFAVDRTILPGTYASSLELWRFTDETAEVYRSNDGAPRCSLPRPYHTDGANIILEAAGGCPAETVSAWRQTSDGTSLSLVSDKTIPDLVKVDDQGAKAAFFAFDIKPEYVPADLKALIPQEPTDASVAAARAGFQAAWTGARVKLKKSVVDLVAAFKPGRLAAEEGVAFSKGVAFKPSPMLAARTVSREVSMLSRPADLGAPTCYLWSESSLKSPAFAGFDHRIANLEVNHSRRTNGSWLLSQLRLNSSPSGVVLDRSVQTAERTNFERDNMVTFSFEASTINAPLNATALEQDLLLTCFKPRGAEAIALDDVKAAVGDYFDFSK